jgi:hypothetical protein
MGLPAKLSEAGFDFMIVSAILFVVFISVYSVEFNIHVAHAAVGKGVRTALQSSHRIVDA